MSKIKSLVYPVMFAWFGLGVLGCARSKSNRDVAPLPTPADSGTSIPQPPEADFSADKILTGKLNDEFYLWQSRTDSKLLYVLPKLARLRHVALGSANSGPLTASVTSSNVALVGGGFDLTGAPGMIKRLQNAITAQGQGYRVIPIPHTLVESSWHPAGGTMADGQAAGIDRLLLLPTDDAQSMQFQAKLNPQGTEKIKHLGLVTSSWDELFVVDLTWQIDATLVTGSGRNDPLMTHASIECINLHFESSLGLAAWAPSSDAHCAALGLTSDGL